MNDLQSTIFTLRLVQLVLAIPLLALIGQLLVWFLARAVGQAPEKNFFYRILQVIPSPFVKLVRWFTPRLVRDVHIPFAVFGLLCALWLWTTAEIGNTCVRHGLSIRECLAGR